MEKEKLREDKWVLFGEKVGLKMVLKEVLKEQEGL